MYDIAQFKKEKAEPSKQESQISTYISTAEKEWLVAHDINISKLLRTTVSDFVRNNS